MVAYDAHVVDRPSEEDTLACLVAHSRPLRIPRPVVGLFSRCFVLLHLHLALPCFAFLELLDKKTRIHLLVLFFFPCGRCCRLTHSRYVWVCVV